MQYVAVIVHSYVVLVGIARLLDRVSPKPILFGPFSRPTETAVDNVKQLCLLFVRLIGLSFHTPIHQEWRHRTIGSVQAFYPSCGDLNPLLCVVFVDGEVL